MGLRLVGRLSGKTALVTGAGQGIGRAICQQFTAEGAMVVGVDVNEASLLQLDESICAKTHIVDVTDRHQVLTTAECYPAVNVLVNCAGVVPIGSILECSDADWTLCMDVNARAMHHTISAFLPGMRDFGGGAIVNIASIVSSLRGAINRFAYGASKGAVLGITKSVAIDFVEENIRCNAICPGTIDSPSLHERLKVTGDYECALQAFKDRQPMKRLGLVEEVAAVAVLLASDECPFMTGSEIVVDGGWSI